MTEWYEFMALGGVVIFLTLCFFFVLAYSASALDDMKSALGAMRHD